MISVVDHHQTGDSDEVVEDLATAASFSLCRCHFFFFYCRGQCETVRRTQSRPTSKQRYERWKEKQPGSIEEKNKTCVCVCVCRNGGLWRKTTVNYAFTHHITGGVKLERPCVNRVKTNTLSLLQDGEG